MESAKPFPEQVFCAIAGQLASRAADIARFARTRYSFEEWCNWEAFLACSSRPQWQVSPKPMYRSFGVLTSRDYGDLIVRNKDSGAKVFIEIGIVHDGTLSKWADKLTYDASKIKRISPDQAARLHIVLAIALTPVPDSRRSMKHWLSGLDFWNLPGCLQQLTAIGPEGQMEIRGRVYD